MPRVKKYVTAEATPVVDELKDLYYTPQELSSILGLSLSTLAWHRRQGTGPKYVAFSYHTYRYSKEEVARFIEEMTRTSTSATRNYDLRP